MEPITGDESMAKKTGAGLDKKCRIHIHCRRKRLADPGGNSYKAAVDGLVEAGLLRDDSAKYVEEISVSQEKCGTEEEETIISIYV